LNWTYSICQPGEITTKNLPWSKKPASDLWMWSVKLKNISMKPTQHITKYLVEFNQLSTLTGWDHCALQHQFYRKLLACIKDKVSHVGKPNMLPAL
jgi:hypothetical protein